MEPDDYETNAFLLSNISSIAYRIYEPPTEQPYAFSSAAPGIESSLRDDGRLVFYDATRRGIWHFLIRGKDAAPQDAGSVLDQHLDVAGHHLISTEDGSFEPASLHKGRTQGPTATNAAGTVSGNDQAQRSQQGPQPSQRDQEAKDTNLSASEAKASPAPQTSAYENFISAVLLTTSATLCPALGAIPLNYRTLLLPPEQWSPEDKKDGAADQDLVVASFTAYLTTMGSLVITLAMSQCRGLLPLDTTFEGGFAFPGQGIFAAPFGIQASHPLGSVGDIGSVSLAQTPNTQVLSFRGIPDANERTWRQACTKLLQLRGVPHEILDGCAWVNIHIPRRRLQESKNDPKRSKDGTMVTISWPAPLCFRSRVMEFPSANRLNDTVSGQEQSSHDPLGDASRWWHSSPEREERISKRKAERAAPQPMDIDSSGTQAANTTGSTSAILGRPNTAPVGAVYPTPPDGVPQPSGITPTFYGAVGSPRPPQQGAAPPESEEAGPETTHPDGDTMWEPPASKEERSDNNNLLGDSENMLMGGDMFGEDDDITEADFNFFDEQPDNLDLDMAEFDEKGEGSPVKQIAPKLEELRESGQTPSAATPSHDSEGFMKPELKHARSLLSDAPPQMQMQNEQEPSNKQEPTHEQESTIKRPPSPFNPETVFKRVRGAMGISKENASPEQADQSSDRKANVFEKLKFGPSVPLINKKYEAGGRFSFDQDILASQKVSQQHGTLPETSYLRRHNKRNRKSRDYPSLPSGPLARRLAVLEPPASQASPLRGAASPSEDDGSSVESDEDDSSFTSDDATSPVKLGFKRAAPFDEDAVSQVTSFRDHDTVAAEDHDQQLSMELPRLTKPEPAEMQLSKFFSDPEPLALRASLSDEDVVSIAQVITEQASTGFLKLSGFNVGCDHVVARSARQRLASSARSSLEVLSQTVSAALDSMAPIRLKGFLEVQDVPLQGQSARLQPRAIPGRDPNSEQLKPSNLYQIPSHHLEVRRAESKLSVLPAAVSFWESLGLAPASGSKNVQAACVFPGWTGMVDNVGAFLDRMKSVYELLRLGSLEQLPLPGGLAPGLIPYEPDAMSTSPDASMMGQGSAIVESMDVLQSVLSTSAAEMNFVIFMVYFPDNPGTIVEACLEFQRFVDTYWKPLSGKELGRQELVLQLVSADLISSPMSLVMTPLSDLVKLCIETYDRCASFTGPVPSPAIVLEQALPRIIDFRLTGTPSSSLIHENSCIHVAYAQSVDERWVTAAWTDDRGCQQATAAYCLGRRGRPLSTSMHEVAHEIWESTLEIISRFKVHWRVIITKCGVMTPQEIEFWADLARTESKANIAMILMTVDTCPSLQLLPPAVQVSASTMSLQTTPVSTPQANILSPEQGNTPATPMRDAGAPLTAGTPGADANEIEPDSVLADLTDQTWGAIVGHRLSNSSTPLDLQPALVSGYLIKRASSSPEDPPIVMEVNLVHTESTARAYEPLLREMLSNFRGLGTLARARGVVEREADVRPWHVAAAEKSVRALHMLM